jgi:hypothetical protein
MPEHFYERNIVEIKDEYTTFLINIITPLIFEGIKDLYNKALITEDKFNKACRDNPNIQNPGVFKIFQIYLKELPNLNSNSIEGEYQRIKEKSKCSEWFDDLVKAIVKSNIVLLTYNASGKTCKLVNDKLHETIDVKLFTHKCYIECARIFINYPELFYHKFRTIDIKRNQREAYDLIKTAIHEAIRKMLPIKLILEEYLKNDYIQVENIKDNPNSESQFENMQDLVKRDLHEQSSQVNSFKESHNQKDDNNMMRILDSESISDELGDIESDVDNMENLGDLKDLILGDRNTLSATTLDKHDKEDFAKKEANKSEEKSNPNENERKEEENKHDTEEPKKVRSNTEIELSEKLKNPIYLDGPPMKSSKKTKSPQNIFEKKQSPSKKDNNDSKVEKNEIDADSINIDIVRSNINKRQKLDLNDKTALYDKLLNS